MTDARTIIIEALGPEVPASWRKQVADRTFTALRSAGFEVCAVAAPTITPNDLTDDDYRNIEWCLREWATVEAQVAELARNGYELHRVAAPTITPQPRESIEALRRDPLAARSIDAAVHDHWWNDALDAVLAVLDGVGGSITPADQEDTDERQG